MNSLTKAFVAGAAIATLTTQAIAQKPATADAQKETKKSLVDPKLPVYKPVKAGLSGTLNSVGSDTLNNLMTLWAESFRKVYPNIKIEIEGKGSSTAPPALIRGTAQLGPMSRAMKKSEIDKFEKRFGYKPTPIRVSIDALAVYVHKDNPLKQLTLQQVDAIFSKTRKGGLKSDIRTWGDAGLTGAWANKPIRIYGRNSASGTYGYFKKKALFKGDYKDTVKEQPGSASVVRSITEDKFGIGYSGIGYRTSGVKTLALAKKPGKVFYGTGTKAVESGRYPLSRFLLVYCNKAPNKSVDPVVHEFIKFVLSRQGQEIVVKDGYLPLKAKMAAAILSSLEEL